jgi:hypothetical protein
MPALLEKKNYLINAENLDNKIPFSTEDDDDDEVKFCSLLAILNVNHDFSIAVGPKASTVFVSLSKCEVILTCRPNN